MKWLIPMLAAGAAQAGTFQLPAGCTGVVTVQQRNCEVSHYYRCEGDPEGHTHRIDLGEEGIIFFTVTDYEGRWLDSTDVDPPSRSTMGIELDPASLSELLETRTDSFDFSMRDDNGVIEEYRGYDTLTGESVDIDGVTLLRTQFEMSVYSNGTLIWGSEGREFVWPEQRVFLAGKSKVTLPSGETYERDGTPIRIDFPGDEGFLSTRPIQGCSVGLADAADLLDERSGA